MEQMRLHRLRSDAISVLEELRVQQGDIATFSLGRQRVVYVSDPDLILEGFQKNSGKSNKRARVQRWWLKQPPLFEYDRWFRTHDRDDHLAARRALNPSLSNKYIQATDGMPDRVEAMCDHLSGRDISVVYAADMLLFAAMAPVLLGKDVTIEFTDEFTRRFEQIRPVRPHPVTSRFTEKWSWLLHPRSNWKASSAAMELMELTEEVMWWHDSAEGSLNRVLDGDVPEMFTWLLSVFDASTTMIRLLAHLPSDNPMGTTLEAIRLEAPWTVARLVVDPFEVGGVELGRGDWLLASPYHVHRDARFFTDPEEFRPERWTRDFQRALPRGAFFPWGFGSRTCMGENLATISLLTTAQVLSDSFSVGKLDVLRRTPVMPRSGWFTGELPLSVRFERR